MIILDVGNVFYNDRLASQYLQIKVMYLNIYRCASSTVLVTLYTNSLLAIVCNHLVPNRHLISEEIVVTRYIY